MAAKSKKKKEREKMHDNLYKVRRREEKNVKQEKDMWKIYL